MKVLIAILMAGMAGRYSALQPKEANVTTTVVQEPFYVAGYLVRTNNAKEMAGQGEIGKLWQRFMQEGLGAKIPNRADAALTVVYSDYASDEKGDYNYLLGARVTSIDGLPDGMTCKKVQAGPYAAVTTEVGEIPSVLQTAWRKIWQMSPAELGGKRAFMTDYEIYDARSANPIQAQVEIRLGLRPAGSWQVTHP